MSEFENLKEGVLDLYNSDLKFLFVLFFCLVAYFIIKSITPFFLRLSVLSFKDSKENSHVRKRINTLSVLIDTTSWIIILIYFIFFVLQELSIDVEPVLLGAGILTFPLAFGSQSLVKDVIAGIFIILENQYNLGDWIKVDKYEGKVVDISFRRTILQSAGGARHIIPNGQIAVVTNNTNSFSILNLDIPVKVNQDFNKAHKIIDKEIQKIAKDKNFKELFIETPQNKGVNEIQNNAAIVRIWAKVKTGGKIKIKRELSDRIINEFSKKKIELPGKTVN
ncbi:MAG: mechanosensitive ion channel [Candidatus Moranbacteria bacterium]|nr:mechanosensitive ion channel [Candidatus Moranbacteria bacterium]